MDKRDFALIVCRRSISNIERDLESLHQHLHYLKQWVLAAENGTGLSEIEEYKTK